MLMILGPLAAIVVVAVAVFLIDRIVEDPTTPRRDLHIFKRDI